MQANYLTAREASQYIGMSESYLAKQRKEVGEIAGPKSIRIGLRSNPYKRSDLDAWMASRRKGFGGVE